MAGLLDELVSGVVDSALKEILRKSGVRKTRTNRTRRKSTKSKSGGLLADIVEAALVKTKKPPRKQVSRRKSAASRSRQRTR
ncbi:hypothetical protein [Sinorhizobium sp. BG8]|uniref:hypothetical protein n=1 Tax=Sinorhizobium sp. BG8 TaxID=2613773 RepID=UPI00193EAA33|nr:hypothetical protein [Sinorhizobium sp. BG8]QRM55640.1 hypothetical protein F3Y30_14735 [Sinorhizobium sp. BG8]